MKMSSALGTRIANRATPPPAPSPKDEGPRLIGMATHVSQDLEIFGEGEPADHVYKVVSGAVRGLRLLSDGRRQICEFYLPGDVFGVEPGGDHLMTAEALKDTVLVVARRSTVGREDDGPDVRELWSLAMTQLRRSHDHVLTLGRRSASERVANFLLDLAERIGDGEHLELPMSRQDIADYLGLTIETVSRTLTQLQSSGLIKFSSCRSVDLCRHRALIEIAA